MASTPSTTVLQVPGVAVQEVDVGAAPAALEVHEQPAAVVGEGDVGPRLLVRQVGEARRVGLGRRRRAGATTRCGGSPPRRPRPSPGPGSACTRSRCRRAATPPTRRGCGGGRPGAACRWPRRGSAASSARRRPVDVPKATRSPSGDGSYQSIAEVTCRSRRPDRSGPGRARRPASVERAHHQRGPVVVGPPVDREEAVAADRGRRRGAGLGQLRQAGAEPPPGRDGVEGGSGSIVLGGGPGPDLVGGAVLQPAVRVSDLDAVQGLDDVVDPGGRGRRDLVQGVGYELRPRLGFRPWLAFFLRARWVAFLVRFDIGMPRYRSPGASRSSLA